MSTATRTHVDAVASFELGDRRIVEVNGKRVGVFKLEDGFVAYLNICAHQGGPVCEGQYFPSVRADLAEGGVLLRERMDRGAPHLVCPWHGWEYDLSTGQVAADRNISLQRYEVTVEDGQVYVEG